MTSRERKAAPIGEVIRTIFENLESRKTEKEAIDDCWRRIAGEAAFRHSRPGGLKKQTLTVHVDNSVWMQELSLRKRSLLKELKRTFGKDKISELRLKIGEF